MGVYKKNIVVIQCGHILTVCVLLKYFAFTKLVEYSCQHHGMDTLIDVTCASKH